MAVYTYDRTLGLVKIVERKGNYYVYRLEHVAINLHTKQRRYIFDKHYCKKWHYQPYEEQDISHNPDIFLEDIRKFEFYKIRYEI